MDNYKFNRELEKLEEGNKKIDLKSLEDYCQLKVDINSIKSWFNYPRFTIEEDGVDPRKFN